MEKSKLMSIIMSGCLILMLLVVNLFFAYKIVYHKDTEELMVGLRSSVNNNIENFKAVDEEINVEVQSLKGNEVGKEKEKDIKNRIEEQKTIFTKVENLGKDSMFKKDIYEIRSLMKEQRDLNNFILAKLIEKNSLEVEEYMGKKEEIINSIDKSYIGLYNEIDKIVKPIDRANITPENAQNIILGQWQDEINNKTYYFSKDKFVHISSNNKIKKYDYSFMGYEDGVFKVSINNSDGSIEKNIILNNNNSMAKVKSVEPDNEILEYWSYVDSKQEPK